jgi:hypothetical protein
MPTNNYQVTWDETNKKWTCKEDGAAVYDLVENSTVETEVFNLKDVTAVPHPTGAQTKIGHHTNNWTYLRQAGGNYDIFQSLIVKGDILGCSGTYRHRLGVGANGYQLEADSAQTYGIKWAAKSSSPLTTKGDLYTYSTVDAREALDTDYRWVVPLSTETTGLTWFNPPYAEVYRNGSFTMVVNTAYNITWNGETSDAWGCFGGTIYFTAPIEGTYLIEVAQDMTGGRGLHRLRIYPSTGQQALAEWGFGATHCYFSSTFMVQLPAAGTFYVQVQQGAVGNETGCVTTTWSVLRVHWIGPYN